MISAVSSRYARALVDVVFDPKSGLKPTDVSGQLESIEQLLASSADLRNAMLSPAIPASKKRAVIEQLATELGVSRLIKNFLFVLIGHNRLASLPEIHEAWDELADEHMGFVRAGIRSAAPLNEPQTAALERELARVTGKQVRMNVSVDPELLGGVVARIGSTVYDGSVRGRLERLRRRLTSEVGV